MGMIEGFFWVAKFGKYFLGIQNNMNNGGSACISWPHSSANKVPPNLFFNFFNILGVILHLFH